jgi:hypothetical protein
MVLHAVGVGGVFYFLNTHTEFVASSGEPIRLQIVRSEVVKTRDLGPEMAQTAKVNRKIELKKRILNEGKKETEKVGQTTAIVSYGDLFPQNKNQRFGTSNDDEVGSGLEGARSYDPESDRYSYDDKARNMARLNGFARELSERISVPSAIKELEPSGKAFLRFSRKKDGWRIVAVDGDPYYRALIFEVMDKLSKQSQAYHLLDETDYDSVRIYFSFRTASSLDLTVKPVETKTDANKVFIDITYKEAGAAWNVAMPQINERGETTVGVNLLGVGMVAYNAVKHDKPSEDIEARKLRLSPAFARPFGR